MPTISVVMATYNGARYVVEQLTSLSSQTHLPHELIVSDDLSTDDTVALVKTFAETAPFPVRVCVNVSRKGYRDNFSDAALLSTSDLVAFCDQDDIWHSEKLATLAKLFSSDDKILLAHHNAAVVTEDGHYVRDLNAEHFLPPVSDPLTVMPWTFPLGFTQVFRRELLDYAGLRLESRDTINTKAALAHDQWFYFLATVLGKTAYCSKLLANYRQHRANLYGAGGSKPGFLSDLATRVQARDGQHYESLALAAENRASLLGRMLEDGKLVPEFESNCRSGVRLYGQVAQSLRGRARVYSAGSMFSRLNAWVGLIRTGAYTSSDTWKFTKKAGALDFVVGVMPGLRLVTLLGRHPS